ncbi:VanZ family protein [Candidatus Gracilibacteria bacterium]|nr:VanZ family protein [Candidatus Gracilibacteria bacterium]
MSFSPIIEIWPTTTTYINFLPFQSSNYQSNFIIGHFLLLIPAGFLLPVFIKNKKNVILTGLGIAIGIEILQFIFIGVLGLIGLTIGKTVTTDEMMINFVGFMIGFLCFLIFAYLLKVLGIKTKELTI